MAEITAKQFMLFEDNEDGTTTVTGNLGDETGGQDLVFLLPIPMTSFLDFLPPEAIESASRITEAMVHIPNDAEGA